MMKSYFVGQVPTIKNITLMSSFLLCHRGYRTSYTLCVCSLRQMSEVSWHVVFDEDGSLQLRTQTEEDDILYDEIGSVLKIKQLQREKEELFESLEMYYRVFYLGEAYEGEE